MNRFEAIQKFRMIVNLVEENIMFLQSIQENTTYVMNEYGDWKVVRISSSIYSNFEMVLGCNTEVPYVSFEVLASRDWSDGSLKLTPSDMPHLRVLAQHEWPLFIGGKWVSSAWEDLLRGAHV